MSKIETIIYRPDINNLHNLQTTTVSFPDQEIFIFKKRFMVIKLKILINANTKNHQMKHSPSPKNAIIYNIYTIYKAKMVMIIKVSNKN